MRILLTVDPEIPVPPPQYGGIERIVDGIITELRARGHAVGLAAHPESTCPVDAFYAWPALSSRGGAASLANARRLRTAVRDFEPDVIHSFSRLLYLLPLLGSGVPRIMSYGRFPSRRTVGASAWLAGDSLAFTGCSEFICRLGRRGGGKWVRVYNFVPLQNFTFQPRVDADAPLVFLSRVERIKGAHAAIDIARRAGRRLIIAGNRPAGAQHDEYWATEIAPHLGRDVEYVGPVDDAQKNELLGRAAAMLVPIEWDEPFGMVFTEALACGTPVLSRPRGGLPEIVTSGVHGLLSESDDELVEAVKKIGMIDRQVCRRRAEEAFSREAVVSEYEAMYRAMLPGGALRAARAPLSRPREVERTA